MKPWEPRIPGEYFFSPSIGLNANRRTEVAAHCPESCHLLDAEHVRWRDGTVTLVRTVWGRLGRSPGEATANTEACLRRQEFD